MLKQVSKEEAFKRYQEGQDVKILRPSSNTGRLVLFTFDELFQDSICLIDDKSDLKHVNTKSTEETCSTSTRGRKQKVDVDKIVPPEPYIAVPAIQALSYSMNSNDLRSMYANLLATSMNADKKWNVHPSFVEVIKQLSPDEAKILKSLTKDSYPIIDLRLVNPNGSFKVIVRNYTDVADEISEHPNKIFSYLDNLKRLELIEIPVGMRIANESAYKHLEEHSEIKKIHDKSNCRKDEL